VSAIIAAVPSDTINLFIGAGVYQKKSRAVDGRAARGWNFDVSTSRILSAALLAIGAFFLQCSGEDEPVDLPEVVYDGDASDEALERVWPKIASAELSDTRAARITAPMNNQEISSSSPPTFSWALATSERPASPSLGGGGAKLAQGVLYFGSAIAEAHLPPVTGEVYLVELDLSSHGSTREPLRLFTTKLDWTPDAASWDLLKSAAGAIRIKIYNAYLNKNVLEEGPFTREETVSFTIGG
jgi:hypothetical protein